MLTYYRIEVSQNPYSRVTDMMEVPCPNGRVIEVFVHYDLNKVLEEYQRMLVKYPNSEVSLTSIRIPN